MKKPLLIMLGVLCLNAFAGERAGNGGVSVVCRNQDDTIKHAQILDLYEGEVLYGKIYDESRTDENRMDTIKDLLKDHPTLIERIQTEIAKVKKSIHFIPEGNELILIDDALPSIIKRGCRFEQLANYRDEGDILVSTEIYNKLSNPNLNKFALIVHEAIYSLLRKFDAKDSRVARKLTAELLAENSDINNINKILEKDFGLTQNQTCGTQGNLIQKMRSCFFTSMGKSSNFTLISNYDKGVSNDDNRLQVYQQNKNGFLWTSVLNWKDFKTARDVCRDLNFMTNDKENSWRLPTASEIKNAYNQNIMSTIGSGNELGTWMWTTTTGRQDWYRLALDLRDGTFFHRKMSDKAHFMCVQIIE